jgi:serine O-acetyltransferase
MVPARKKNRTSPSKNPLEQVVSRLCDPDSFRQVTFRDIHHTPMPSVRILGETVEQLRAILFPGYFGLFDLSPKNMTYQVGASVDRVSRLLTEQFRSGFCMACSKEDDSECPECTARSVECVTRFISSLPEIRRLLAGDVQAAYVGDPASRDQNEVIFCYPSIKALTSYRIAHEMYRLNVPLIPRIITEMAHSETGIDIHPGARIGEQFFIDHGTGTVIGETTIIGRNVRVYQGVTLGAKSFPLDRDGNPIKGIPRHPIVEDDVIIYAGATILGRITVGKGAVIGGNVWITEDVEPGARIIQHRPKPASFENGSGI